jgi:outer membrane protein OmpA-like peptidoglycan-associated protein
MNRAKLSLFIAAVAGLSLMSSGCLATRKHVRNQIAPVQAQVNQVQKETNDNKQAIGDLDRNLATTDEKATEAGKRAQAAMDAANQANSAAQQAGQKADSATQLAQQTGNRLDTTVANIDNYRLVDTQKVYFPFGKSTLTDEGKQALDNAISQIGNVKNYVLELEGFTDKTGSKTYNLALSERRADTVERYLTEHNVPLRKIHVVGVGKDESTGKTRAERKEDRRVDIRVYALDLTGQAANQPMSSSTNMPANTGNGAADRMSNAPADNGNMPASTNSNMPAATPQPQAPPNTTTP